MYLCIVRLGRPLHWWALVVQAGKKTNSSNLQLVNTDDSSLVLPVWGKSSLLSLLLRFYDLEDAVLNSLSLLAWHERFDDQEGHGCVKFDDVGGLENVIE